MENEKYKLIKEPGKKGLSRIVALKDIERHNVEKDQKGGLIESEANLSQEGDCWIGHGSSVIENGFVCGNALIKNSNISGDATVGGKAKIFGSKIFDESVVMDAEVHASTIEGTSDISGKVYIDTSKITDCKLSTRTGLLDIRFSELISMEMNCPARILDAGRYDGK